MNGIKLLTTFALLLGITSVNCTAIYKQNECHEILVDWLYNLVPIKNDTTESLYVDWTDLDANLTKHKCPFKELWIELWILKERPKNELSFATPEYWNKFDHCSKLTPESFEYHSTRSYSLTDMSKNKDKLSQFYHVIEEEYMLRLCPCGNGGGKRLLTSSNFKINKCECEYSNTTHCSDIKRIHEVAKPINPWCLDEKVPKVPDINKHVSINPPEEQNCTSIKLTGSIHSCTRIQSYDKVQVILTPLKETENNCKADFPVDTEIPNLTGLAPLEANSETPSIGLFTVYLTYNFTTLRQSKKIETKDEILHPYRSSRISLLPSRRLRH